MGQKGAQNKLRCDLFRTGQDMDSKRVMKEMKNREKWKSRVLSCKPELL